MPAREAELDLLMSRLAHGERSAFDALYLALRPRALGVARLRLGETEAADVAQQALERVFARASEFTPGRPCLPWFYGIVASEIQSNRRRRARLVLEEAPGLELAAEGDDAEAELLQRELRRALDGAIDELDADAAHAISALLGHASPPDVKPATFRKRLSRAYSKLRLLLGGNNAS
jgi:RNA polymerase sigma-70 factor (ECF subfamily)